MTPLFKDAKHISRLEELKKINPKIDVRKHERDDTICQNYLSKENTYEFETMLVHALARIERKLKYGRKQLYLFDDYVTVYEEVVEVVLRKIKDFRGGSLFDTWVFGIMKKSLLKFY